MPAIAPAITREAVLSSLCIHDRRHPDFAEHHDPEQPRAAAEPGCGCDNCFYGRHPLAAALLATWSGVES
jgi:hypothetical protein